jgi:hypothetical protein
MTYLVTILFGLAYLGMALGRIPGLRIDRAGIAMIVAVVLVVAGAVPTDGIAGAIHFPTLLLLGSLMVLSARVGASRFYDAAAAWIAGVTVDLQTRGNTGAFSPLGEVSGLRQCVAGAGGFELVCDAIDLAMERVICSTALSLFSAH